MTTFLIKFADQHKTYLETLYNVSHNYGSDCGIDLYMPEDITIEPYETKMIDLGIKAEYLAEDGTYLGYQLYPRSSIYKTKIRLANSVGIIDPEYRGYLKVVIDNISNKPQYLFKGNRYFQVVFVRMDKPSKVEIVDEVSITTRNEKGFGSTNQDNKIITHIIKAFKFNKFTELTSIEYDSSKPIGKIYKSKIAYMCGIPLMIDWLNDNTRDNQFATYIMADPLTGFAPEEFQSKAGTIILFREDHIELTENDIQYIWNYFAMLMNYTVYQNTGNKIKKFNTWNDMIKYLCMNKKSYDNCKRVINEQDIENGN